MYSSWELLLNSSLYQIKKNSRDYFVQWLILLQRMNQTHYLMRCWNLIRKVLKSLFWRDTRPSMTTLKYTERVKSLFTSEKSYKQCYQMEQHWKDTVI